MASYHHVASTAHSGGRLRVEHSAKPKEACGMRRIIRNCGEGNYLAIAGNMASTYIGHNEIYQSQNAPPRA